MALLIGEKETRRLIGMARALTVVEKFFHDRASGKMRSLARRRLKASQKQLNVMAAWHAGWDLICLRAYAGEANTITLYDGRTGQIQAVIHMGYLSSLRTGAASGVAAKYLAPAEPRALGISGPGWQATFQVEAVVRSCPIRQVMVSGRNPKRTKEFIRQVGKGLSVAFTEAPAPEVEAAADILVLATDSTTPLAGGNALKNEVLEIGRASCRER